MSAFIPRTPGPILPPGLYLEMTEERAPKSLAEEGNGQLDFHAFLKSLRASELVPEERLLPLVEKFMRDSTAAPRGEAFARVLLAAGLLTPWQLEKLSQGENRSFLLGGYRLLCFLGRGAMGVVYLAEHPRMGRRVALKVLPRDMVAQPRTLEQFYQEARALAALDHPNIVRAYDINQEGPLHFLVLEYVDGPDLEKLVKEQGPLPCDAAVDFIQQTAEGLAHAHARGFIHRDVKPSNLILHSNGLVKILDLGLAQWGKGGDPRGEMVGTPQFMAPEQAGSPEDVDARSDIYSLGCVFYFLLTGRYPFLGKTLSEILLAHQFREPIPIEDFRRDVPAPVREIVRKMMAKGPADRYQTAGEVAEVLKDWHKHRRDLESRRAPPNAVDLAAGKPSVLVVDDDPAVRRILEKTLQNAGYTVKTASDGAEALEVIDSSYAVCLLDLDMPRIGGLECLREVRRRYPETFVIMISAAGHLQTAVSAMREGAFDYFSKPCDVAHVLIRIEEALNARRRRLAVGSALDSVMHEWQTQQPIFGGLGRDEG